MTGWRKSSRSAANGACVEIRAWRTSSRSNSGACVEAGDGDGVIGVRDSKLGERSAVLGFRPEAWRRFTEGLKAP